MENQRDYPELQDEYKLNLVNSQIDIQFFKIFSSIG